MTKVTTTCGIDVSKAFFDACLLQQGKTTLKHFTNDKAGMQELQKWLGKDVHCVMEASGPYYLRLAVYLYEKAIAVSVVNPLVIRRFSQMRLLRAKTDKADAGVIAQYALAEQPPLWQPPARYIIALQQLSALSDQLQKHHRALQNQLEAFSSSGLMDKVTDRFIGKAIKHLQKQQLEIERKVEELIIQYHGELMQRLLSIPGLGKKSVAVLIMLTGGFTRFTSSKQLAAYVGLSPRIFESGKSVRGKARICKMGMSRIRALLYVCAWSASKCNSACKNLYDRLVQKGKAKKLALIAVAHKLLKQAFSLATKNTYYDCNYTKNICL